MPQTCRTCALGPEKVKEIEVQYINGASINQLKNSYGVSYDSMRYHLENHTSTKIAKGAQAVLETDGLNLMQRIDQLLKRLERIFKRNDRKERDRMALRALSEQRNVFELLAKISYALHQNKLAELEQQKMNQLSQELPIERLTKEEQELLFELNLKLLGETDEINLSDISDFGQEKGENTENEPLNKKRTPPPEQMTRNKPPKPKPESEPDPKQDPDDPESSEEEPMRFRPLKSKMTDQQALQLRRQGRKRAAWYNNIQEWQQDLRQDHDLSHGPPLPTPGPDSD